MNYSSHPQPVWLVCTRSVFSLWVLLLIDTAAAGPPVPDWSAVKDHARHGRYEEGLELLEAFLPLGIPPALETAAGGDNSRPATGTPAALPTETSAEFPLEYPEWAARLLLATGRSRAAQIWLERGLHRFPNETALQTLLARLHFDQGNWQSSQELVQQILQQTPDDPSARLLQSDLYVATGQYALAEEGYRWFVRYYNRVQPTEPETLLLVAQGSTQYARVRGSSQIFDFVLNTLLVDALKADPQCWPAAWLSGELLLEKYNRAEGIPELKRALAINPRASAIHATLAKAEALEYLWDKAELSARTAVEINPGCVAGWCVLVDVALYREDLPAAKLAAESGLRAGPRDPAVLAALAAIQLAKQPGMSLEDWRNMLAEAALAGSPPAKEHSAAVADQPAPSVFQNHISATTVTCESSLKEILAAAFQNNPRPAVFLTSVGQLLETRRRLAHAELAYRQAISAWPQLAQPKNLLGLITMQMGRVAEAQQILDEAFALDPYYVRVSNMRKVIKVLDGYGTVTTPHFVIRSDTKLDRLLSGYIARYLEEVYGPLTEQFGYEPPQRTQIEIYNQSKGLSAHQWFSARMIGLPWIQTIGASTGMMIAMVSPSGLEEPINWARVLKHEYVHVITIQQTDFNIAHWFTEALATRAEDRPRPEEWNRLLIERVPAGRLRSLETLNLGFQRAEDAADWNMSYCQSLLCAEYMAERFGEDSLRKLLEAYRNGLPTRAAIEQASGVSLEDFETGYHNDLKRIVATLNGPAGLQRLTAEQLSEQLSERPADPLLLGEQALSRWEAGEEDEAVEQAEDVLKATTGELRSLQVLAEAAAKTRDWPRVRELLAPCDAMETLPGRIIELQARAALEQKDLPEAKRHYRRGQQQAPWETRWWTGLALVAGREQNTTDLKIALEMLAQADYDKPAYPRRRAEIALTEQDFPSVTRFATEALYTDVLDVRHHRLLAAGLLGQRDAAGARRELEVALELQPGEAEIELELAAAIYLSGEVETARQRLGDLQRRFPDDDQYQTAEATWVERAALWNMQAPEGQKTDGRSEANTLEPVTVEPPSQSTPESEGSQ